ncbi:MAG: hypothetical protein IJ391_03770 [Clostridia bacterium]|nr:hypothetical protein [Clostridia bacterium]
MNNKQGKSQKRHPAGGGMTGTIIITVLITLLFAAMIYVMYVFNIVSVFDLSEYFSDKTDNSSLLDDNGDLYDDMLAVGDYNDYQLIYKVTPEELTAILAEFKTDTSFTLDAEIVNYNSNQSLVTRIGATRDGDTFEIKKYVDGELSETTVSDGETVTVTDEIRNRSARHTAGESFDFEALCSIPSTDDLSSICKDILDQGDSTVTEYDISLVSSDDQSLYKVVFTYPDISQREEYYISPETEMIVNAFSYFGDSLYYRYSLTRYTAD